jgi:hypothetical protein
MQPNPPSESPELYRFIGAYHVTSYRANGERWKTKGDYRYHQSGWHRTDSSSRATGVLPSNQAEREEIASSVADIRKDMEEKLMASPKFAAFKARLLELMPSVAARNLWRDEQNQRPGAWKLIRKALARKGYEVTNEQLAELAVLDQASEEEFEASRDHTAEAEEARIKKRNSQMAAGKLAMIALALGR